MVELFDIALIVGAVAVLAVAFFVLTRKKSPAKSIATPSITPSPSLDKLKKKDKDAAADVVVTGPPITILFGSQSGTAETFAYELAKEAKTHNFNPKVVDLEEYDHENNLPKEKFVCFLLATFGEGEPTDSAQKLYEWIMNEERDPDTVRGVDFAVFGLGNRQYEHFCAMGRRVNKRMLDLGGTQLLEAGEGDDDGSLEDDYGTWKKAFWAAAKAKFGGTDSKDNEVPKFECSFSVEMKDFNSKDEDEDFVVVGDEPDLGLVMDHKHNGDFVPVLDNYELRQDPSSGSTRHIVLDLSHAPFAYRTADNIGVCPRNDFKLAAKMAKRLGVHTKSTFVLHAKSKDAHKLPFPANCSVHDALLWYCDLTSIPKRGLLEVLASFADAGDKAKLLSWCSDSKAAFHEDQKNLLEVLEEVPSVKPPFEAFLEFVPKLVPRFYTISSSSKVDSTKCTLTVSVTRSDKPRGRVHQGVCSTFLASLVPGKDKCPIFVRPSTFRPPWAPAQTGHTPVLSAIPAPGQVPTITRSRSESKVQDAEMPVIMVGPGTGVAPFRGFLEEAKHLKAAGVKLGKMYLYFGCQKRDRDFIYRDELNEYAREGIVELITAFSRESGKKVYVQHRMEERDAQVWDLIDNQKGYIYLCGGTAMGRDVRNVLTEVIKKHGGKSEAAAKEYVNNLQTSGRFIQELWS